MVYSQFIQVVNNMRQHLLSLPCYKKISVCLNIYEVADSGIYFCGLYFFFPFHFSTLRCSVSTQRATLYHSVKFRIWVGFFFFQLALSQRNYEILGENICVIPW